MVESRRNFCRSAESDHIARPSSRVIYWRRSCTTLELSLPRYEGMRFDNLSANIDRGLHQQKPPHTFGSRSDTSKFGVPPFPIHSTESLLGQLRIPGRCWTGP